MFPKELLSAALSQLHLFCLIFCSANAPFTARLMVNLFWCTIVPMIGAFSPSCDVRNIFVMKAVVSLGVLRCVAFAREQFILYLVQ